MQNESKMLDLLKQRVEREMALVPQLIEENPLLNFVSAYTIAQDIISAENATQLLEKGMPAEKAVNTIGSYARFQWAYENLPRHILLAKICELWRQSDPDDTRQEYLELWKIVFKAHGHAVYDSVDLPNNDELIVFRGQLPKNKLGISWTLDIKVARKFATSGGLRQSFDDGIVLRAKLRRDKALGYLTLRYESEVIADPEDLQEITIIESASS